MTERTKTAVLVLRLVGILLTGVGLSVSVTWIAYALFAAPMTAMLSPKLALTSLVFPVCAALLVVLSRPLARVITSDLNRPTGHCEHCGYPTPPSSVCSECGREVTPGTAPPSGVD